MSALSRSLQPVSMLRHISTRKIAPSTILARRQLRFINTQGDELGGVQGSEPPSPQKNPVNWRAGTITAVGVGVAVAVMWGAKAKEKQ